MEIHESARRSTLQNIASTLENDERFVAAWLAGSFGRGEEDAFSDLDLGIAVAEDHAVDTCATDRTTGAGTTDERLGIVAAFGEPVNIHEQHANAPLGATFTSVIYRSGVAVDWTFVPHSGARRETETILLFDQVGVPVADRSVCPEGAEIAERLAERYAFFWMLAFPAAKAWRRQDGVRFHSVLELMYGAQRDIEHLLRGELPTYTRHSLAPFCPTGDQQRRALAKICESVRSCSTAIEATGARLHSTPDKILDTWLGL